MSLTDENSSGIPATMLVGPTGYGGNSGGFGFGGDWAWILLLLLIGGNGWGMGGFGGGMMWPMMMGGFGGGFGMDYLYPWLNNSEHISDGFRDQHLQSSIDSLHNSVTAGFGDVDPSSTMIFVPAAAEDFGNVGADIIVTVPCMCTCSSVSVRNTSTIPITVQNANILFDIA